MNTIATHPYRFDHPRLATAAAGAMIDGVETCAVAWARHCPAELAQARICRVADV